ncbi:MAG: serine hydrolase domain-containing protein [Acidimicrobiia bacterium]
MAPDLLPDSIRETLHSWREALGAPGAAIAVRCPGQPDRIATGGCDGSTAMPSDRLVRIASLTKTFTSALVLDLVGRGELALADPAGRWVPGYPNASEITVRSLLDHTAGTADPIFDAYADYLELLLSDLGRSYAPAEVVDLAARRPAHHRPATEYRYSNTDYALLGCILESIIGDPFATIVHDRITRPLGLNDTGFGLAVPAELAHGWFDLGSDGTPGPHLNRNLDIVDFPNEALLSLAYAAGGMTSSLTDLLTWAQALYLGDFLTQPMRAALLESPTHPDPEGGRHGLGVFAYGTAPPSDRPIAYGHTGNIVGSSTFVAAFPRTATVVAVHANVLEVPAPALVRLAFTAAGEDTP